MIMKKFRKTQWLTQLRFMFEIDCLFVSWWANYVGFIKMDWLQHVLAADFVHLLIKQFKINFGFNHTSQTFSDRWVKWIAVVLFYSPLNLKMAKLIFQLLVLACVIYLTVASVGIALPNPSNCVSKWNSLFPAQKLSSNVWSIQL